MDKREREGVPDPQPAAEPQASSNRNIIIMMGGFFLLGIALALLLFGGPLFDNFAAQNPADLPQIPSSREEQNSEIPAANTLLAGDQAVEFTLLDLDSNDVSLSDYSGQPVVLNFWATWCAPCRIEMPELQNAFEAYQDQDLVILAINAQEEEQLVGDFFNDLGLTFTPLLDGEGNVGRAYGAFGLPSTYFVDRSGEITAVHRGILTGEQIEGYLAQILP
jgi:cytochrome c biogenesis protein CcmG, thiol:disulfide interchange protein DsbE